MADEPEYRLAPGLGVLGFQGRIIVYQMCGDQLLWARVLGQAEALELDDELREAIDADRKKIES